VIGKGVEGAGMAGGRVSPKWPFACEGEGGVGVLAVHPVLLPEKTGHCRARRNRHAAWQGLWHLELDRRSEWASCVLRECGANGIHGGLASQSRLTADKSRPAVPVGVWGIYPRQEALTTAPG
jgi:hypothetical protein